MLQIHSPHLCMAFAWPLSYPSLMLILVIHLPFMLMETIAHGRPYHLSVSLMPSSSIPLLTTSRCQGSGRPTCTQRQPRRPPTPGSIPPRGSPAMGAPRRRRRGCCQQMSSSPTARFRPTKLSTLPRRLQQQALHRRQAAAVGHVRGGAGGWQLGPTPRTSGDASLTSAFSFIVFLR